MPENNANLNNANNTSTTTHSNITNNNEIGQQENDIVQSSSVVPRVNVDGSNNIRPSTATIGSKLKLFPNQRVGFTDQLQQYCTGKVISRAGKATGKYANTYNIEYDLPSEKCGTQEYVDFDRMTNLEVFPDDDVGVDVFFSNTKKQNDDKLMFQDAKLTELASWEENNVYDCVKNVGQRCISTRWVTTMKNKDGKLVPKARLVARGFEEYGKQYIEKESPTCSREAIRVALSISRMNNWDFHSIDVKTAFLQGNHNLLNRDIFVTPPPEAKCDADVLWKLKKAVYGLVDASKVWWESVKTFMLNNGGQQTVADPAVFYWHDDEKDTHGCILSYVDDFLWFGNYNFKVNIVDKLCKTFTISKQADSNFNYIGLNLSTLPDGSMALDQQDYCASLEYISIPSSYKQTCSVLPLTKAQRDELQSKIGQLLWLSCQSRPDLCFDVCKLSNHFKNANVNDLIDCNKVIRKAKANPVMLRYRHLENIDNLKFLVFADASFANLSDGGSQGGI